MLAVWQVALGFLVSHPAVFVIAAWGARFREGSSSSILKETNDWEGGRVRSPWSALRDLVYNKKGELSFSELKMETHEEMHMEAGGTPLYPVNVNLDIEALDMGAGITMMFDKQQHSMRLDEGISPADGLAWGLYKDNIGSSGWSELYMFTSGNPTITNDVKMFAAGFVEGILTCIRMSQYYHNNHKLLLIDEKDHHALMNIKGVLNNELGFVKFKSSLIDHIMSEEPAAPYWKHSRYLFFQMWGINDGYNFAAKHFNVHTLSLIDMFLINTGGEIPEMMEAYQPIAAADRLAAQSPGPMLLQQRRARRRRIHNGEYLRPKTPFMAGGEKKKTSGNRSPRSLRLVRDEDRKKQLGTGWKLSMMAPNSTVDPLDDAHWEQRVASDGHCSAFVRVANGDADLFVGHTTWDDYSEMTRVFKYYTFPLHGADVVASTVAMSSYPGCISSMDDFYMLDSGMVITETSIELLDPTLFDKLNDFPMKPHIPNFMHIMITNRLAKTANHWASLYTEINTGTYNSEWMIVDYNNFVPGKPVPDNTLWVLETIPGMTHAEDMSHRLRAQRYWASYNRPFFQDVREASGHDGAQKSHGALYSWADNPRATIFRGAGGGVNSLFDMRGLMDRNMYPFAGVEPNEPGHEISARMDLSPTQPIPNGGIDAKITNRCLFKQMICQAISGPTHATQPVFSWVNDDGTPKWPTFPHVGQPDHWNFGWVQITPGGPAGILDC